MAGDRDAVTTLLYEWSRGDSAALDRLTPLVYDELHRLAALYLRRERRNHTLQPTALVHEAYLRLIGGDQPEWDGRGHFYAFAARVMRQVLVDYARKRATGKRDGVKIALDEEIAAPPGRLVDLLALDRALTELDAVDARKSRMIELRYFAGMGVDETAAATRVSVATVRRELRLGEAWLHRAMSGQTAVAGRP
jgi:RNA polymerase sigma-70 factor (ECF subfamily)